MVQSTSVPDEAHCDHLMKELPAKRDVKFCLSGLREVIVPDLTLTNEQLVKMLDEQGRIHFIAEGGKEVTIYAHAVDAIISAPSEGDSTA